MVNVGVPPGTLLPDAPYHVDSAGDVWMGLPNGEFAMIIYGYGRVTWATADTATLAGLRASGVQLVRSTTYSEAMITILLKVISRFETSLRAANLI